MFGIAMLIMASHARAFGEGRVPDLVPDLVAGYQTWQGLGRQVMRGQRGHTIPAPRTHTIREAVDRAGERRELDRGEPPAPGETPATRRPVVGWTTTTVFSMSQTDGAALALRPEPRVLTGQAPPGLWDGLAAQVTTAPPLTHSGAHQGTHSFVPDARTSPAGVGETSSPSDEVQTSATTAAAGVRSASSASPAAAPRSAHWPALVIVAGRIRPPCVPMRPRAHRCSDVRENSNWCMDWCMDP